VNTMRTIFHLACADFLERTRRYGFLVVLGLVVFLGYQVASDSLGLHLGGYRGEYNSAWVGSMMALIASIFLGWFGFYVVNSSVARDRETGVGQIMAATPMSRLLYVAGKWTSNFFVLVAMVIILALAGIAIQLFQGEYLRLDLIAFLRPFILLTLPMIALVAGLAVLFECIRFLSGGFGNIVYFFMFIFFIAAIELPGVDAALEPTGVAVINEGMSAEVLQRYPGSTGRRLGS
jgi:ABC-type transport system involved in multi-copper enzyme maturation permease subunit